MMENTSKQQTFKYEMIPIKSLAFWGENPRHGLNKSHDTPEKCIKALFEKAPKDMKNLAEDMLKFGFVHNDLPIVMKIDDGTDKYRVYEGNRRVANLWCINNPSFLSDATDKAKYEQLQSDFGEKIPSEIYCVVSTDINWVFGAIERLHSGQSGGVGRTHWGTLEKESFKATIGDVQGVETRLKPSYVLTKTFPDFFEKLIELLKPTNVDRILEKEKFKKGLQIQSYADISVDMAKALHATLISANAKSSSTTGGISRHYNEDSIINELLPFAQAKYEKMLKERKIPVLDLIKYEVELRHGEEFEINSLVNDHHIFDKLSVTTYKGNLSFNSDKTRITGSSTVGKHEMYVSGLLEDFETMKRLVVITIKRNSTTMKGKSNTRVFENEFGLKTIDIPSINDFINQANTLTWVKHGALMKICLRIALEESLKIFFMISKIKSSGSLNEKITNFKDFFSINELELLSEKSGLSFQSMRSKLNEINVPKTSALLNDYVHNANKTHIENFVTISKHVSNIIAMISEYIK